MNLGEAQLFRLLSEFFGMERVFYNMSLDCVYNEFITDYDTPVIFSDQESFRAWRRLRKFQFTVVNGDHSPRVVIDLTHDEQGAIDYNKINNLDVVKAVLETAGVIYVTINQSDLFKLMDPENSLDLCTLLLGKINST
jgi:hypothetical protein